MFKSVALFFFALLLVWCPVIAQQGYAWRFGTSTTSPFSSAAAMPGSPTYTLTKFGSGTFTSGVSVTTGTGPSCGSASHVASFTTGVGLTFDNDNGTGGQLISGTYTIEMVVKFDVDDIDRRLFGFHDLSSGPQAMNGIYVNTQNRIGFLRNYDYQAIDEGAVTPDYIDANEWHQIVLVRNDITKTFSLYQNGVYRGDMPDTSAYELKPRSDNDYQITFLKDDDDDEAAGQVAKIALYNRVLTSAEIRKSFDNICNVGLQLPSTPLVGGYQWLFSKTPFSPFSSEAIGGFSTESYLLQDLGSGSFTQVEDTTLDDLGGSCQPVEKVGQFTTDYGLRFSNSPFFVYDDYTVEMVVKVDNMDGWTPLISFSDATGNGVDSASGIFIENWYGKIGLWDSENGWYYPLTVSQEQVFVAGEWYHLTFSRDHKEKKIHFYQNGAYGGYFDDRNYYEFIPKAVHNYTMSFLKAADGDERSGRLGRLAIYNTALDSAQVAARFANACLLPDTSSGAAWHTTGNVVDSSHFLGTLNNQPLVFKTNNQEVMRILPGGEVGIGDSAARSGYKLSVRGHLLAEKVVVKSPGNWPDYVFHKGYRLPPIKEVEAFFRKYKHLPGIPSAIEVEQKGVEVASMQAALLKKIEELTLYMVEMDKEMEKIEKRIEKAEQQKVTSGNIKSAQ